MTYTNYGDLVFDNDLVDRSKLQVPEDPRILGERLNYLTEAAKNLCNEQELGWRNVAGRLEILKRYHRYGELDLALTPYDAEDLSHSILLNIADIYDSRLNVYSYEDIYAVAKLARREYDFLYDYAGANLLNTRYLHQHEYLQEAYIVIALMMALPEASKRRVLVAKEIYLAIATLKISLATPILAGLRFPNSNLASCFIVMCDDSLNSIAKLWYQVAKISKEGGGVGINISRIRARGAEIKGRTNAANGIGPMLKIINDIALAFDQGGRRKGAVTAALDVWHLDIEEFLEINSESGDQRTKAHDIFPQVVIPDLFMRKVLLDEDWYLFDPHEVKQVTGYDLPELWGPEFEAVYEQLIDPETYLDHLTLTRKVNAKALYKQIMKAQLETGLPYIAFKDTINLGNPNKHVGYIPSANLCCESFSVTNTDTYSHTCNLASLNLARITEEADIHGYTKLGIRILDNAIEVSNSPLDSTKYHNQQLRTIGLGTMGLADNLALMSESYQSHTYISAIYERIAFAAIEASVELAQERGAYPQFANSEWSKGIFLNGKELEEIQEISLNNDTDLPWSSLEQKLLKHGIRNSQLLAIAPNTSTSLVHGCTASVLPPLQKFFINRGEGSAPVAPFYIEHAQYEFNATTDQQVVVDAMAKIAQWIDTGISMELMFNLNPGVYEHQDEGQAITAKEIFDICVSAWKQNCKTIYYIRSVQRDAAVEVPQAECAVCSN